VRPWPKALNPNFQMPNQISTSKSQTHEVG
jgi:hypothetical protein